VGGIIDNLGGIVADKQRQIRGVIESTGRPDEPATVARRLLPELVRTHLQRQLLAGTLREGDQVVEYRVAQSLGISQTPVREALRQLERDGLVVTRPHRGTYVRRVTRRDAAERYSLGMELEAFAVRLSMPRLTPTDFAYLEGIIDDMSRAATSGDPGSNDHARSVELNVAFHRHIVESANHRMLLDAWLSVNPLNWRFTTYAQMVNPDPLFLAERHRTILIALRGGDQLLAAAAMRAHIWEVAEQVLPNIAEEVESDESTMI
jgi:DNA-binding GntR family transcriptional regulator